MIKQLDQREINRIIEEEEKYRREHASNNNDTHDSDDDDDDEDDEEEQKEAPPLITAPTDPSIMMLDELVAIFDHDYNDELEADEENDNEQRIQGINEVKNKKGYANPIIEMLGELLDIFDY